MNAEQMAYTYRRISEICELTEERKAMLDKVVAEEAAFTAPELLAWKLNIRINDLINEWLAEDASA